MIDYKILSTGSKGNAVILQNLILIDCGVPYKTIKPYVKSLKIVLLTHKHGDHFCKATVSTLAKNRPTLRFGCCKWLVKDLVDCGVAKTNIDIYDELSIYNYGFFSLSVVDLVHDVPNCGYKIHFPFGKVFYATDTNSLNGINAYHYDLYMVEANYTDKEISERIKEKQAAGEYAYELNVLKNHLSKEKCDNWIYQNIGQNGEYVYLHSHEN